MGQRRNGRRTDERRSEPRLPRFGLRLWLARAALAWERLWPALWPAVGVLAVFVAAALLDLLPALGPWGHLAALAGFAALLAVAVWRGLRGLRLPDIEAARRRLERDSGLAHRPLSALDDRPVLGRGDDEAADLWAAHRRRLLDGLRRLRLRLPRGSLAAADPYGVRAALLLLLVVAAAAAGPEAPQRLWRAAVPQVSAADPSPPQVDVWVDPPAYTGLPPRFLQARTEAGTTLALPDGSQLLAQVQGGDGVPTLGIADEQVSFDRLPSGAYKASAELAAGTDGRLAVMQDGEVLADWRLRVVPDRSPTVEFVSPPTHGQRNALRLEYGAEDDYGLQRVAVRIVRRNGGGEAIELALPLPGLGLKSAENASYHDLTPHPWAGLPVELTLTAEDARGQVGESNPVATVLPERVFQHPVARRLVELRKRLTLEPDNRYPVVRGLRELGRRPHHFFGDVVVALAIRAAERRLVYDKRAEAVAEVQQLMWETALRIEEGELAIAERELRRVQRELMEALGREAPEEEIARLMEEMQAALDRFLQALAERMAEEMARGGEPQELPEGAELLRGGDLQKMLDMARRMAESGARDAAREMLGRLQEILENLRMSPLARGLDEQAEEALDIMRDMQSLTQRQQELLDRSFRRSQRSPGEGEAGGQRLPGLQSRPGAGSALGDAEQQEAVRRGLGRLMRRLGQALGGIPRPLGRAEQEMRGAVDALRREAPGEAVGPQGRALDQLRQGMQAMAEAFRQQMGERSGEGQGRFGWRPGAQQDPLGRPTGDSLGMESAEDVDIPEEMELKRAHEILRELRRRSGQRSRPELELDYIDRLLQRF